MSTRASLNNEMLERLTITFPEFPEQRAIAHILGTLDDKIECNRRMNETLEAMARALFKAWFVDFEPVRAKLDAALGHLGLFDEQEVQERTERRELSVENRQLYAENRKLLQENGRLREELARLRPFSLGAG